MRSNECFKLSFQVSHIISLTANQFGQSTLNGNPRYISSRLTWKLKNDFPFFASYGVDLAETSSSSHCLRRLQSRVERNDEIGEDESVMKPFVATHGGSP